MTIQPPRPCIYPGCKRITVEKNGYCQLHQRVYDEKQAARRRRRGGDSTARSRGYTRTWEKIRSEVLYSEPFCRACRADGFIKNADRVHHRDHNPQNNLRENLVPLCHKCHEKIHGRIK